MMHRNRPSRTLTLPSPIGGWNARDSLAAMDRKDAVTLQNFWVNTTDVMFRKGYTRFAYGLVNQVETIMWYSSGTSNKLFSIGGGDIWDISTGGDFSAGTPDVTGLTNSRFQYINVTTAGGSFLLSVNAADKLQGYTGSAWYADGDGTHDITGLDTATAAHINLHKNRVWFCQTGTLKAWYLATNAIAGAATAFDLSAIARKGGYLMAMYTWTIDAGYGVDDLAVWITSNGEIIVYRGTDPASAATWALVGVWQLGSPLGRRCGIKFGGDLLFMTQDGIVPMAQGLQSSRLDPRINLTDKIQSAVSAAATMYGGNFGWNMMYFAKENMILMNVPVQENQNQQQYAMNTISKAWCNFTDIQANCWEIYQDNPYFGGNGFVGLFWNGYTDYPTEAGVNINCRALQAYNDCGAPGSQKHFRMIQPILNTDGSPAIYANVNIDFDLSDNTAPLSFSPITYATWDSAVWDADVWAGALNIQKSWQGANGVGQWMALQLKGASMTIETHWMASTVVFADGGIL